MTRTTVRRFAVIVVATFVVFAADLVVVPAVFDDRSACQRVAAWVEDNAETLPATFAALATYPVEYRRAIFAALPSETRSALFREHYRLFEASRRLTPEQQRVVALAASLASPGFYAAGGKHTAETLANYAELGRQIAAAFPNTEDRLAFSRLGPVEPVGLTTGALVLRMRQGMRSIFVAQAEGFECVCSMQQPSGGVDCASGSICATSEPACDQQPGCGPSQGWTCDGLCYTPGL